MPLSALINEITNFLSPPLCTGCKKSSQTVLCMSCQTLLAHSLSPQFTRELLPPLDALFAAFQNVRPTDLCVRLIKLMKYSSNRTHADFFAHFFADFLIKVFDLTPYLNKNFVLCPIPLHPLKQLQRGFNQSMLLADALSQRLNIPCLSLLKRRFYTPTQTFLTKEYRIKNMFNVFAITDQKLVKNNSILLIDDLCTTGSTLREAAKTLKTEGACFVAALVIGRVSPEK